MTVSAEREWANEHPQGAWHPDVGPMFTIYNFDINEYKLKDEHIEFIQSTRFSDFFSRQLHRGQGIVVLGLASTSGRRQSNLVLSARRAVEVKQEIIKQIGFLQRTGQFDRYDSSFINQMIVCRATGSYSLNLTRPDNPLFILSDEALSFALSRSVQITINSVGSLPHEQVEAIGREYIRSNYRHLNLPRDFRFNELWTPTVHSLRLLVPNPVIDINASSSRARGSRVPDSRNWTPYSPSYRAMDEFLSQGSYTQMSKKLQNHFFTLAEVHRAIRELMNEANAARNFLHTLEREIVRWVNQSGAAGGASSAQEAIRCYQNFREAVFLRDGTCLFQFNGFHKITFTGVSRLANGQYVR